MIAVVSAREMSHIVSDVKQLAQNNYFYFYEDFSLHSIHTVIYFSCRKKAT